MNSSQSEFFDQQRGRYLGACWKGKSWGPSPDLMNQILGMEPSNLLQVLHVILIPANI